MDIRDERLMECGICAVQPGGAELCQSCLHNRYLISQLKTQRDDLHHRLASAEAEIRMWKAGIVAWQNAAIDLVKELRTKEGI